MDTAKKTCAKVAENLQTRLEMEMSFGTGFACLTPFVIADIPQVNSVSHDPAHVVAQANSQSPVHVEQDSSTTTPAQNKIRATAVGMSFAENVISPVKGIAPAVEDSHDHIEVHVLPRHTGDEKKIELINPLAEEALVCRKCGLCESRRQVVFGEGSLDAELMFIGQAPGREEDLQGKPLAGNEGRFLDGVLRKGIRRSREEMYCCDIIKCRPPGNRKPEPAEMECCLPYLRRQIEIIRPKVIVAIGGVAASMLTGDKVSIEKMRGCWYEFMGIPLMPVYHTAFMVRMQRMREANGDSKAASYMRIFWEDLKLVCNKLGWEHA